jgi:hypothetical protein
MTHAELNDPKTRAILAIAKLVAAEFKGGAEIATLATRYRMTVGDVEYLIRMVMQVKP